MQIKIKALIELAVKPPVKVIYTEEHTDEKARYGYCCNYVVRCKCLSKRSGSERIDVIKIHCVRFMYYVMGIAIRRSRLSKLTDYPILDW